MNLNHFGHVGSATATEVERWSQMTPKGLKLRVGLDQRQPSSNWCFKNFNPMFIGSTAFFSWTTYWIHPLKLNWNCENEDNSSWSILEHLGSMTILWASRPPAPSAASWSRRASSSSWRWLSGGDVLGEVGATEAWDFNRVRDTTG